VKAGPALFVGFVLLGLLRTFPVQIGVIVGVIVLTGLLTWGLVAVVRVLDGRQEARAAVTARADQQHQWVWVGDPRGVYGTGWSTVREHEDLVRPPG
jgi:hypothetical protein